MGVVIVLVTSWLFGFGLDEKLAFESDLLLVFCLESMITICEYDAES